MLSSCRDYRGTFNKCSLLNITEAEYFSLIMIPASLVFEFLFNLNLSLDYLF